MADTQHDVVIIGAGLGGLLTGAFLASRGRTVTFLEALDFVGGRFTHIDYEGFAVPTGAFHALPGGMHGPIGDCLRTIGIELPLVSPDPALMIVTGGQRYPLHFPPFQGRNFALRRALNIHRKGAFVGRTLAYGIAGLFGRDHTVAEWFRGLSPDDQAIRLVDHLTTFSFGVSAAESAVLYILRSLKAQRHAPEGFLPGGNRSLVTALLDSALARGATLRTRTPVTRILFDGDRATGVETADGARLGARLVISNAGIHRTAALLGDHAPREFRQQTERARPAYGAGHAIRCRRPLHDHASIEMPLDLDQIAGIAPISRLCPNLCPSGWHFSLAYQVLDVALPIEPQLTAARRELTSHMGADIDIFNSAVFQGGYPAAAVAPRVGQHGNARFAPTIPGLRALYLAGEDLAGYGFAAEIIGDSCRTLWRRWDREGLP